ncbi:MAG TPA: PilZ domain-containing protein [Gemmataceae bacterium]|jgi:hypothetical protein|nr:PilZ domain-containing protein [Gemmataceae bacterium]
MSSPITTPQPGAQPGGNVECRVYERYASDVRTACQPIAARAAQDLKWSASVCNVSLGGIALLLNRRFERGTGLAIEVPELGSDQTYTVFAKVARVSAQEDGSWLHGCAFAGELSEEGLKALSQPAQAEPCPAALDVPPPGEPAPVPLDEPAAPHQEDPPPSQIIRGVHFRARLREGKLISRFVKRLSVSGPWPPAKGTILNGRVGKRSGRQVPVKMKVRSCYQEGGFWVLTCKLMDTLPPEVVRLFQ